MALVETLLNSEENRRQKQFGNLNSMEIVAAISMQKLALHEIDSTREQISYGEASEFIKDILSFALSSSSSPEGLEIASEVFLAPIFGYLKMIFVF